MDKNDILDYVMNTPGNTNRAVLSSMLNSMEGSGSGGGSTPSMPIVGDGKTRLYVTVASIDRPVISIYFGCTVVGGVTIDWGDGSETEVTTSTEITRYSHSYSAVGDYIITLEVTDGELVLVGGISANGPRGITQVIDSSEGIPYTLFYNRSTLKMVEIGSGINSIGEYAFCYCISLTSVVIPEGVTSIGSGAFYACSSLTSVVIPSSVTSIGNGAFSGCTSLTSVVIPEGVTSIEVSTFSNCSVLTSVVIPSSVTSIGKSAFYTCSSLTSVVIPEGVASIEEGAFSGCASLTSVVIPEGVTSIGKNAFSGCSALGGIHILSSTPPALGSSALSNIPSDCKIYVPAGSLEAYSTAINWSSYASMMVEE